MKAKLKLHLLLLLALLSLPGFAHAQGTAFNYQGRLNDAGAPATGLYDFTFNVFDVEAAGAALAGPIALDAVPVTNGVFNVSLDFGPNIFTGPARWLEITVRTNGFGAPSLLTPRTSLLPTPYAIFAGKAGSVASGTVTADQLNTGGVPPKPGQFLSYAGGDFLWTDPGVAAGDVWTKIGADAYYNSGNVGIGTMGPLTPLEVNGIVRSTRSSVAPQYIQLNGGDSGSIKLTAQSTLAAEKNLLIQNLSGEAAPGVNNSIRFELGTTAATSTKMTLTRDGNLGIGTISPQNKVHVYDPAGSVSQRIETGGGINAWAQTEYANADGLWKVGTSRGFNGDQLYFARHGAAGIAFGLQPNGDAFLQGKLNVNGGMAVTSGNVGIGTATPGAKLHVETSQPTTAAVYGNATGAGGVGVYGQSASGAAVFAQGNAVQPHDKGGFVKAMAYIDPFLPADRYVVRCYNSQSHDPAAPDCGITVTRISKGFYKIDFGFKVDDRFFSITPVVSVDNFTSDFSVLVPMIAKTSPITTSSSVVVHVRNAEPVYVDSAFYITVY